MTAGEALAEGIALLRALPGIESPGLDAALLLAELLKTDRSRLVLMDAEPVSGETLRLFRQLLERRRRGECTAYILGRREFWGLEFTVTPAVLVPRPDTETLVEAALSRLGRPFPHAAGPTGPVDAAGFVDSAGSASPAGPPPGTSAVLDLCTGSGAVAIALKYENPGLRVSAADISAAALEVARENARKLLAERPGTPLVFIQSDLFENIPGRFDCITANPPYIPTEIIDTLPREVRGEPRLALDGGSGGLDIIRRLIPEAALHLNPGGALFIEADPRQMAAITGILENCGYRSITIWKDLPGRDRVIGGLWK